MNIADFVHYSTADLCNASTAVKVLGPAIRPLIPGMRVAGRACTARISPGQNAAIHRAVHLAQTGDMLVVDGAGSERFGPFGDLLAERCCVLGMAGGVFDCTIRDSADIASLGFQVFARGFHPEATAKSDLGDVNIPVMVCGVTVSPGDVVVGDDDGVVIVPTGVAEEVLRSVRQVTAREKKIRDRIHRGESTLEIFNIDAPEILP